MKELKSCVGIDISKDSFEVCIKQLKDERSVIKATRSFQNDYPGFEKLLSWTLSKVSNPIFVMETHAAARLHRVAIRQQIKDK